MAGITLADAEAQLATWIAASTAVASGQSYKIDTGGVNRELTRVNAGDIGKQITFWDGWVKRLSRTNRRTRQLVPKHETTADDA